MDKQIFVFGSNLGGYHGKGAAYDALHKHGAVYGQAAGLQGNSYAIPTKDARLNTLTLAEIQVHVDRFVKFAFMCDLHKRGLIFNVTKIGCGLAGYTPNDIAPLFRYAIELANVFLPDEFITVINTTFKKAKFKKKVCIQCGHDFAPNSGSQVICCRGQ